MSAVRSRPRAPFRISAFYIGTFFCTLANQTSLALVFFGTGLALVPNFAAASSLAWLNKVFKDVADKNNQYFGCFCLAIPTRTISNKCLLYRHFFCALANQTSLALVFLGTGLALVPNFAAKHAFLAFLAIL